MEKVFINKKNYTEVNSKKENNNNKKSTWLDDYAK